MKKTTLFLLLFVGAAGLYFLYLKGYLFANFESVSPKEAYEMIQNDPETAVLDVRTPGEYAQGHIATARLVPVQRLGEALQKGELKDLRGKKIVVYCRSGMRSAAASRALADRGFKPYNVLGGINAWRGDGLPVKVGGSS